MAAPGELADHRAAPALSSGGTPRSNPSRDRHLDGVVVGGIPLSSLLNVEARAALLGEIRRQQRERVVGQARHVEGRLRELRALWRSRR